MKLLLGFLLVLAPALDAKSPRKLVLKMTCRVNEITATFSFYSKLDGELQLETKGQKSETKLKFTQFKDRQGDVVPSIDWEVERGDIHPDRNLRRRIAFSLDLEDPRSPVPVALFLSPERAETTCTLLKLDLSLWELEAIRFSQSRLPK